MARRRGDSRLGLAAPADRSGVGGAIGALALPPFGFAPAMIVPMTRRGVADRRRGRRAAKRRDALGLAEIGLRAPAGGGASAISSPASGGSASAFLVDADQFALGAAVRRRSACRCSWRCFPRLASRSRGRSGRTARRGRCARRRTGASRMAARRLLTGFPWNEIRHGARPAPGRRRSPPIVGLHGLTLIDRGHLRRAGDAWTGRGTLARRPRRGGSRSRRCCGFGAWRLPSAAPAPVAGPKLRLMQPNIAQGRDFSAENGAAILAGYLALSDRATSPERHSGVADVTLLFWPESAFPFMLARDRGALARIADFLRGGAMLVTGAARARGGRPQRRCRLFQFDPGRSTGSGLLPERYDKRHLVPFGEYLPFGRWFDRIRRHPVRPFSGRLRPRSRRRRGSTSPACRRAGDGLLRGDLPQRVRRRATARPPRAAGCSTSPTTPGSASPPGPTSISPRRGCARSSSACRCVRVANTGISAHGRRAAASSRMRRSGAEAVIDGALPGRAAADLAGALGRGDFGACALAALAFARAASPISRAAGKVDAIRRKPVS